MYDEYLKKLDEAGKIRNLKDRSISCYHNYVAYFLNYVGKDPKELTCQDVRDFLLRKKDEGLKATTLNLYNSSIRFFYKFVLGILWDEILVPRMIAVIIFQLERYARSSTHLYINHKYKQNFQDKALFLHLEAS